MNKAGVTRKKTTSYREADADAQADFLAKISEIPPKNRVYVDESGLDSRDHRSHGRAAKGVKVVEKITGKRKKRVNVIGAFFGSKLKGTLRTIGPFCKKIFTFWIENELIPPLSPGMTVIMDNASIHKSKGIEELINSAGCSLLYLPPYSPELNPIERKWGTVKAIYRGLPETMFGHAFRVFSAINKLDAN